MHEDEIITFSLTFKREFGIGELSLQTSFTTFCRGTHHGTSSAAILLVENIKSFSLSEIQDNNSVNGSANKNLSE